MRGRNTPRNAADDRTSDVDRGTATPARESDAALLARVRAGDSAAYGQLWSRYVNTGRGIARSLTQRYDADDLVSEAFVRILSAIRHGAGPDENFLAYLRVTIRAVGASWSRAVPPIVESQALEVPLESIAADERQHDDILLVQQLFRALPERSRNVLWLTVIEGMNPRETGDALRISPGAAAVLAHRARTALRRKWEAAITV